MRLRFSRENWDKFAKGKKTTTRFHKLEDGVYDAIVGSRFKPVVVGKVSIRFDYRIGEAAEITLPYHIVNPAEARIGEELAKREVFHCRYCLFAELMRLNPKKSPHDIVYVHKAEVIK